MSLYCRGMAKGWDNHVLHFLIIECIQREDEFRIYPTSCAISLGSINDREKLPQSFSKHLMDANDRLKIEDTTMQQEKRHFGKQKCIGGD